MSLLQDFCRWTEERCYAWHQSRQFLDVYRRVLQEQPGLDGRALYKTVVSHMPSFDPERAEAVVSGAQHTCEWPVPRELRLRDVAGFFIVSEYLHSRPGRVGTRVNMRAIVSRVIPRNV